MAKWVAETQTEQEFEELVKEHGVKLKALWDEMKALSDKTGIPVGDYTPPGYNEKFAWNVEPEFVKALTGATGDLWYHSQAIC